MKERLQKLMAQANIGSRRACEALIEQGRVRVNGTVVKPGDKADPAVDVIEVDGERLHFDNLAKVYIALNKPVNVVSTNIGRRDDDRPTVRDLIPVEGHLFTIGRLDAESDGLMVLTNDGDLANRLTHPRYQHTKTYKVVVYGLPSAEVIRQWESGVDLGEEGKTAPCSVDIVKGDKNLTTLRVVMTEGKKRQIRRVATLLGHPVRSLTRTHIGKLGLGTLRPGEWRDLGADDLKALKTPDPALRTARSAVRPHRRTPSPRGSSVQRTSTTRQTGSKGGKRRSR